MTDSRLVTPDLIENRVIDTLRDRHLEHLAKLERAAGIRPRTLARLRTIAAFSDEGARTAADQAGAVLLGVVGLASQPERNDLDAYDVWLNLAVEVYVSGRSRRDTLRRRDWIGWAVAECIVQRTPRDDLTSAIDLVDWEPQDAANGDSVRATAQMIFQILVPNMLSARGLPPADTDWPDGGPGGPPADPHDPPVPLPVAHPVTFSLTRASIE